jgi:hypothetical protein
MPVATSFLAPPDLLSLLAIAADSDPDLGKGTHLRIVPSPLLGLPVSPFCVWRMNSSLFQPTVYWHDAKQQVVGRPDLDAAGGELFGWLTPPGLDQGRLIGHEPIPLIPDGFSAALLANIGERLMVARSQANFQVASPTPYRLRIRGRGAIETVRSYMVSPDLMFETMFGQQPTILSLPVDDQPWYAGGLGKDQGLKRVQEGAPLRYGPPDRPDGPFDPLSADAEMARVAALTDPVDQQLASVLSDQLTLPSKVFIKNELVANLALTQPRQATAFSGTNALLVESMDPGVARYLGLMTRIDSLPADPRQPDAWIAAGVFLVDLFQALPDGRKLGDLLAAPDAVEIRLLGRMLSFFPALQRIQGLIANTHLQMRCLAIPALGAPSPDRLEAPLVELGTSRWIREAEGVSTRFRQDFLINEPPLAGEAALARQDQGIWQSRHSVLTLAAGSDPATRSAPLLPGQKTLTVGPPTGLVVDVDIPAAGAPWTYRLWLADLFGRFGLPAEFQVPEPARQGPPRPALQTLIHPNPRAAGQDPAAFGTIEIRIPVPLAENLTAGALPIATVVVTVDGASQTPAAVEDTVAILIFKLPDLQPMESQRLSITARFVDTAGTASEQTEASVGITDPRPPIIIPTGPALIWTSRPGPAAEVELKLAWQGTPGHRYRAYLADAPGIGVATFDPGVPPVPHSRAQIGVDGAALARGGALDRRDRFRLLTDPPLVADAAGNVLLDELLPRTLSTVQFLRIVSTSANGSEAPFAEPGLIPIAVPADRRQPPPTLAISVDADAGIATVTIAAIGIDLVTLGTEEPGLFTDPPDPDAHAPEFRLRRAASSVADPIYAREVARGFLQFTTINGTPTMAAIVTDGTVKPLDAYVSYAYWAEIRMPSERRVPAGVIEIPEAAGVHGIDPAQESDALATFSLPSAPAPAIRVPAQPISLDAGQIIATTTAGPVPNTYLLNVTITGAPTTVGLAIGSYSIKLWQQEGDQPFTTNALDGLSLDNGQLNFTSDPMPFVGEVPSVTVLILLVDPLGRNSPAITVVSSPA